jgi:hypothetical protein
MTFIPEDTELLAMCDDIIRWHERNNPSDPHASRELTITRALKSRLLSPAIGAERLPLDTVQSERADKIMEASQTEFLSALGATLPPTTSKPKGE